ncbi:hypothetical protein B0G57_102217 [Trinickia symbiotica]|uniref:hypothetical protein n=1 Tax=Trinickia symbiotica TaxID=863227 RepID=UPI000D42BB99|nr:hypothetical protein [Trinickia symbiotica]PPK46622.1 hypothetical protein B0G57_102217 [Trinickia symbiotica]
MNLTVDLTTEDVNENEISFIDWNTASLPATPLPCFSFAFLVPLDGINAVVQNSCYDPRVIRQMPANA